MRRTLVIIPRGQGHSGSGLSLAFNWVVCCPLAAAATVVVSNGPFILFQSWGFQKSELGLPRLTPRRPPGWFFLEAPRNNCPFAFPALRLELLAEESDLPPNSGPLGLRGHPPPRDP